MNAPPTTQTMGSPWRLVVALVACCEALPPATVYIMRHCARSTYFPDLEHEATFRYLTNYTDGGPLPAWGVAPQLCTARGREIVRGEGAALAGEFAGYGDRLRAFHDGGSRRDVTTAADFLAGAGLNVTSTAAAALFNPVKAGYCPALSAAAYGASVRAQLAAVTPPPQLAARVAVLQDALGKGAAPPMPAIADAQNATTGGWRGGTAIAAEWVEALLFQLGAGLDVGYGRFDAADVYALTDIHLYARAINDQGAAVARRYASNLLAHVVRALGDAGGAALYVGHDTNVEQVAALLNLTWAIPPYADNLVPPGSILRLRAADVGDDGARRAVVGDLLYVTFEQGALHTKPVAFDAVQPSLDLADFTTRAQASLDAPCVRL